MRRIWLASVVAAAVLIAGPSSAGAAVTIGQTGSPDGSCEPGDWAQPTVTSGTSFVVPATGGTTDWAVISWSHNAKAVADQKLKMKVFRPVAGLTYTVVGQDVVRDLSSGVLNTFQTNIAVKAGDVLGMTVLAGNPGCVSAVPGETFFYEQGDAPTGASVTFVGLPLGSRLNISAVLEPDCDQDGLGDETRDGNVPCGKVCKGEPVTIVGTEGANELAGTPERDVISGLGGKDDISGLAGEDLICGGTGKDTLRGGKGKDRLLGQGGKDRLIGGGGKDVCTGGKKDDSAKKCEVEKSI